MIRTMGSKKRGRPPVDNPRDQMLVMRLTQEERDLIERAATSVDKMPGQWARDIAVECARLKNEETS